MGYDENIKPVEFETKLKIKNSTSKSKFIFQWMKVNIKVGLAPKKYSLYQYLSNNFY